MARPRSFDTTATLAEITSLFWSKGFDGVSVQDIARATGLRPGSLHAAFGNKDDLFAAAFEHYGARFQAHMRVASRGIDGAAEYLDRLVESAVDDADRKGCLIVNTASEMAVHSEAVRASVDERLEAMRGFFRARLAEDGVTSSAQASALFGAAVAILTLARAGQPDRVLREIAASAVGAARDAARAGGAVSAGPPGGRPE